MPCTIINVDRLVLQYHHIGRQGHHQGRWGYSTAQSALSTSIETSDTTSEDEWIVANIHTPAAHFPRSRTPRSCKLVPSTEASNQSPRMLSWTSSKTSGYVPAKCASSTPDSLREEWMVTRIYTPPAKLQGVGSWSEKSERRSIL